MSGYSVICRLEFIQYAYDERVLEDIKKSSNLVVTFIKTKQFNENKIKKSLEKCDTLKDRNNIIHKAYKDGLSQHKLSIIVGVSQTQISRIIKKSMGFT